MIDRLFCHKWGGRKSCEIDFFLMLSLDAYAEELKDHDLVVIGCEANVLAVGNEFGKKKFNCLRMFGRTNDSRKFERI